MAGIVGLTELQHTNGTSAATIDTSGRILTPARPAWSCRLNTAQGASDFTDADGTPVPFDHEEFDIGNNLTVSLNNGAVFTAPITGIYTWSTLVTFASVQDASYIDVYMFVDGDQPTGAQGDGSNDMSYRHIEDPQGGTYHTGNNSGLIQLTAGQTLTPHFRSSGDTSITVRKGSRFSGFLVG